jgi:hypothetical protein
MEVMPVLIATVVPTLAGAVFAPIIRNARNGRSWFSWATILVAVASLGGLVLLDSPTMDRVAQGLLHLVPAASLLALVRPTLNRGDPVPGTSA